MTDANLLSEYATRRDPEAFARLVERYQRPILATCRRVVRQPQDVDDAVQETFLRLAQKAGELRSNLGAWLHRCAVNVSTDLNRRRSTRAKHESAAAAAKGGAAAATAEDAQQTLAELREHLDAALGRIDDDQRKLIIQRYFVGRPQVELASEAGVSPSTISSRLDQAIEALRRQLSQSNAGVAVAGIGVVKLATLLEAEAASAASVPAALTANLMKIGLTGVTSSGAAVVGMTLVTKVLIGLAAAILFGSAIVAAVASRHRADQPKPTAAAAAGSATVAGITTGGNASAPQPPNWSATAPATQPAVLSGRITDSGGKPVPNAVVTLQGSSGASATTDANGYYAFPTIRGSGENRIGVTADGYLPIEPWVSNDPGIRLTPTSQAKRDIVMERGVRIDVKVTDVTGAPVHGADIDVSIANGDRWNRRGIDRQSTNEFGLAGFAIRASNAPVIVAATKAKHQPVHAMIKAESVDRPQSVELVLAPGVAVKGVAICSDGKPAYGWKMFAYPEWWKSNYIPPQADIDKDGNFTLTDVGPGTYQVHVMMGNMSHEVANITFPPATQPFRVDIPHPSPASQVKVTGRVRVTGNEPSYIRVQAMGIGGNRDFFDAQVNFDRRTDGRAAGRIRVGAATKNNVREGSYTFDAIPAGTYRISFESPELEHKELEKVQLPGELPVVDLVVKGKPHLAGIVRDGATGKPVPQFAVRASKLETLGGGPNYVQDSKWVQVSDPTGAFDIELVGPGVYQVQASADNYAWLWSDRLRAESGGDAVKADVKLTAGGSLGGVVADPSGKPVAGAKVIALSMARAGVRGHEDRFEGEAGAVVTDEQGRFKLPHLAGGDETIKIVHHDFAPEVVKDLKIVDAKTADAGTITMKLGGNVEGVVYDEAGKPAPGIVLQFQDESGYSGGDDEIAGRLATATTDESGHYRAEHLPSEVIWVNLADRWEHGGCVRRVVRPLDGKTSKLDFGGATPVKGRLLEGGKPLASQKIELTVESQYFGAVIVTAQTDGAGNFTFHGPPPGRYALFAQAKGERGEWVSVRDGVEVTGQPQDLGDINSDVGDVVITLQADDQAAAKSIRYLSVTTDQPNRMWQNSVSAASPEPNAADKWRAKNVPAGKFRATMHLGEDSPLSLSAPLERKAGAAETPVTLRIAKPTATLTVKFKAVGGDDASPQRAMALRNADGTVSAYVRVDPAKPTTIKLPAGTYGWFDYPTAKLGPGIGPIELKDGETRETEVDLSAMSSSSKSAAAVTSVQLIAWTSDGVFMAGAQPRLLDADGKPAESTGTSGLGPTFTVTPGKYRAVLDRPGGGEPFTQEVDVSAVAEKAKIGRWEAIHLTVPDR